MRKARQPFNQFVLYGGLPCTFAEMLSDLENRVGVKGREAYLSGGVHWLADDDPRNTPEHRALAIMMLKDEL